MIYRRQRALKVPIIDKDGMLMAMLKDHKSVTNEALKFHRDEIRKMVTIEDIDKQAEFRTSIQRKIYARAQARFKYIPKMSFNITCVNSINEPIKEYAKRTRKYKKLLEKNPNAKKQKIRPPRFRRMDLRLRNYHFRVDLDAAIPIVQIGFRPEDGSGVELHPFAIQGSQRYFDKFRNRDTKNTIAFLSYKKGRFWISLVFMEEVNCRHPQNFLGLDAGMYSNLNVWYPTLVDSRGIIIKSSADHPVSAGDDPRLGAIRLVKFAKKNNAAVITEDLKELNRSRSGKRFGIPLAKYIRELKLVCEDYAVPLLDIAPRYTSQMCSSCEHTHKDNRDGIKFLCLKCGHEDHADVNASINIARKGARGETL